MGGNEEKALAEKAFKSEISDGTMFLPDLVSRKEEFIPMLTKASEE
jgi:inorganic pyrophosphatase/exopolyphosphatase